MWNMNTRMPDDISAEQRSLLADDIAAIEEIPSAAGKRDLGPMSRIPEGSEIECCGAGFNEQTVRVRWHGKFYFVFREDLSSRHRPAAKCACC